MRTAIQRSAFVREIEKTIAKHVAYFILVKQKPDSAGPIASASGTMIRIGQYHFILTADHIIDALGNVPGKLALIVPSGTKNQFRFPVSGLKFKFSRFETQSERALYDVAALKLPQHIVDSLENSRFAQLDQVSLKPGSKNYTFTGMPAAYGEVTAERFSKILERTQVDVRCGTLCYRTTPCSRKNIPSDADLTNHFYLREKRGTLLKSSPAYKTTDGKTPRLGGMSGAGIWKFKKSEGVPTGIRLVGIETDAHHGRYLKCSRIELALRLIYRDYPTLPDPLKFYKGGKSKILVPR